ncbi:MAG: hypothetical protein Q7J80_08735, partial [Anaerolineales bacterium]|nr:hypothetical protein [Anaerolineales bacterium]
SFETISKLISGLETIYGPQSGRGLALLIGRACFKYGIHQLSEPLGFEQTSFRMLPYSRKQQVAAQAITNLLHSESDLHVRVEEHENKLLCHIERCPLCWGRELESPTCHLVVGLLQESLGWLSSGKMFNITEMLCIARGAPTCTFEINLHPIT